MSFSYSRDRTAELRNDNTSPTEPDLDSEHFGPRRTPIGYQRNGNRFAQTQPPPPPLAHQDQYHRNDYSRNEYEMEAEPTKPTADLSTMNGFFTEVDSLKDEISRVSDNVEQIEKLHTSALVSFNEQQSRAISKDLDRMKRETQSRNVSIKNRIKNLQAANARAQHDSDLQIRQTQTTALRKRFMDTIARYQDVERMYEQKYRQRVERQIKIVKPDATQEEVENIIDSDETPQIFAQSLMQTSRTGQARAVLSEVQTRHDDIKRIEKTIVELHQLFQDMAMLVEQQGETLNVAENNMQGAVVDLEKGNSFISRAIKSARATRHKKWCCLVLVIILCVVIAILVWWFAFDHPGAAGN